MFSKYVFEKSPALYSKKIMITDFDNIFEKYDYLKIFEDNDFNIIPYVDDLDFRIKYTDILSDNENKFILFVKQDVYIPYDIRKQFEIFEVSYSNLFSKLSSQFLKEVEINFDLLTLAYRDCFSDLRMRLLTEQFFKEKVLSQNNIKFYVKHKFKILCEKAQNAQEYSDWLAIASEKAELMTIAVENDIDLNDENLDTHFINYCLNNFGTLSSKLSKKTPVIVSKAMEFMHDTSSKFAVIVMDGMSEFDWKIISESLKDLKYTKSDMFAMIPTTTSVSRQCLLSGKYPNQLISPWTQSKEKDEFITCAKLLGYQSNQIEYHRGYDEPIGFNAACVAIIINDIDDIVHGQKQGRAGMLNDMKLLAKKEELHDLVKSLLIGGMDVYVTADHGNTPCIGAGKIIGAGVDVETKSRRMIVLKDYADKQALINKYGVYEYPKYYLDHKYDYMICPAGKSLDSKDEEVMTHGGISIDETIIPFISFKAGENNG